VSHARFTPASDSESTPGRTNQRGAEITITVRDQDQNGLSGAGDSLHAILRASVEVRESDPVNSGFQQVGYVSIGESNREDDYLHAHDPDGHFNDADQADE